MNMLIPSFEIVFMQVNDCIIFVESMNDYVDDSLDNSDYEDRKKR
jgi:hypothetical protein